MRGHRGPGAVHLLNGLYDARIDGAPVIAITGLSYHDTIGAHFLQDLPSDRMLEHACMFSERIMGPTHALAATDLAVRSALMNRTPSHLAIPIDVQSFTLEQDTASPKNVPPAPVFGPLSLSRSSRRRSRCAGRGGFERV